MNTPTHKHDDDCKCRKCEEEKEEEYQRWLHLNTCDVCDGLLDTYGICEYCAEKENQNEKKRMM